MKKLRLPKYDRLPATLLGRLARSVDFRGEGIGDHFVLAALKCALDLCRKISSVAVLVDAKDEKAKEFYLPDGFMELPDHPNRLFIPMETIEQLFAK